MARPVKKTPEQWRADILRAAQELFRTKGYEAASVSDIMALAGGAKGMFYHFFQSKEDVMYALGKQLFLKNNPFEAVRSRTDLTALQKIRLLLALNRGDVERNDLNTQAIPILNDPHLLAAAVAENRRILTPLWLELLEEGKQDGSIQTEYVQELSELLPLINFWFLPSIFPANQAALRHKYQFVCAVLSHMGLPLLEEEGVTTFAQALIDGFTEGEAQ